MMGTATDFNDLAQESGIDIVRQQVAEASSIETAGRKPDDTSPLSPPRMADSGFPSLLREIVEVSCKSSEAHPVAVMANIIAMFSCMIGRGPFQRIGDAIIHCRPFMLVTGKSGKARKGTAENTPREIFRRADEMLRERFRSDDRLRIHAGGLSTGEGIAWAIRDAREPDAAGKGGDTGIHDKRLIVIEPEFDNLLSLLRREGNTLSATVRNLFDGRDIEPLTKTSQTKATRPHVVIVGHITGFELREKSTENDLANGLLNRFMVLYVYRPKLVALPEPTPDDQLVFLAKRVADAVQFATRNDYHASNAREIRFGDEAREFWVQRYAQISRDREGRGGSLLARSEVYARMLAMIFCLMDRRDEIEPCDLSAALAWVQYWQASVTYVFQCPDDDVELDPFSAEVLAVITARPGITLTDLQGHWNRKRIKPVKHALERLLNLAPPLVECRKDEHTGGRAALRYHAL